MASGFDTVTFLSDYGTDDESVGVVKSVIRDLAPHATVIDLTHGIAAHDVRSGGLTLARSIQYVASGVILAAVDPGVGTDRRAIAVEIANGAGVLVGPDNGLLAGAVAMAGGPGVVVELSDTDYHLPSPGVTFSGRDIFAPVAAHLCNGVALTAFGPTVDALSLMPATLPIARAEAGGLVVEVLWVDRYGNLQLNAGSEDIDEWGESVRLRLAGEVRTVRRAGTYGSIPPGRIGLVVDSYGLLSICVDRQSAAEELGLDVGDALTIEALDSSGTAGDSDSPNNATTAAVPVSLRASSRSEPS